MISKSSFITYSSREKSSKLRRAGGFIINQAFISYIWKLVMVSEAHQSNENIQGQPEHTSLCGESSSVPHCNDPNPIQNNLKGLDNTLTVHWFGKLIVLQGSIYILSVPVGILTALY